MIWNATTRRRGAARRCDRRLLERLGWRTSLDYRENLVRDDTGVLAGATVEWCAEAERIEPDGTVTVICAVASTPSAAWRRLRSVAARATTNRRASNQREWGLVEQANVTAKELARR